MHGGHDPIGMTLVGAKHNTSTILPQMHMCSTSQMLSRKLRYSRATSDALGSGS